jgi:hypothetical protein
MYERVLLPGLLPKKGSFEILKSCEAIRQKVKITKKDIKTCNVRVEDGNIKWNKTLDKGIEIDWSKEEAALIGTSLALADENQTLPQHQGFLSFYESFFNIHKVQKLIS